MLRIYATDCRRVLEGEITRYVHKGALTPTSLNTMSGGIAMYLFILSVNDGYCSIFGAWQTIAKFSCLYDSIFIAKHGGSMCWKWVESFEHDSSFKVRYFPKRVRVLFLTPLTCTVIVFGLLYNSCTFLGRQSVLMYSHKRLKKNTCS